MNSKHYPSVELRMKLFAFVDRDKIFTIEDNTIVYVEKDVEVI